MSHLEVLATGPQATLQDRGRLGHAAIGVGPSGAADRRSLALANRLVGNDPDAAAIEVLLGGLTLRSAATATIAVTGADVRVDIDRGDGPRAAGSNAVHVLRPGWSLHLGQARRGQRAYVAVRGGVDVPPVLGSRSTDTLAGLGPAPLRSGDRLPIGVARLPFPSVDVAPVAALPDGEVTLRVLRGPRDDWLADAEALVRTTWTVSAQSDRVGARLTRRCGPELRWAEGRGELPSEGVVRGAVQVPPGGEPIVFLADHPVTGGYPVVGVLHDEDADLAGQLRPGQPVRLRWCRAGLERPRVVSSR